jgi:Ca2+-transporting ATPase
VYAGTTVVAGSGLALVVATGPRTLLGSIAAALQGGDRRATPLEERLDQLGNRLIAVFLALCVLLVAVGVAQGHDPRLVVTVAVALAIGAVPEGLPAVATTTLSVAVGRLAAQGVLVRRLDAVETLGSTTVIVTDKTGTLTENRMTVRGVLLAGGTDIRLTRWCIPAHDPRHAGRRPAIRRGRGCRSSRAARRRALQRRRRGARPRTRLARARRPLGGRHHPRCCRPG